MIQEKIVFAIAGGFKIFVSIGTHLVPILILQGFVILLWVTWILTYFAYLTSNDVLSNVQLNCDDAHFGCVVLQGITNWLTIMAQLR